MDTENYVLPSDPSLLSIDPLGICDDEEPSVWPIIVSTIASFRSQRTPTQSIHALPNLIQDLSYSVHMNGNLDTTFLTRHLLEKYSDTQATISCSILNNILDAALGLPSLFPNHRIPYLSQHNPTLRLSTPQIRTLLAHQILNTLKLPIGNDWGCTFSCWYSEPQPLPYAISGYLTCLFDYFTLPANSSDHITYRYHVTPSLTHEGNLSLWTAGQKTPLFDHLVIEPTTAQAITFPHGEVTCTLVASNASPGFGASCTQEELVTAACPPLLPMGALLTSPPIPADATISVHGNLPVFQWKGQGREARLLGTHNTAEHTFLFLDASELDVLKEESTLLPDLDPGYFFRDLHKAYTGLSALAQLGIKEIASPLWGAGAFGGDPIVKTLILGAAAARAGIFIHISVDTERIYPSSSNQGEKLIHLLQRLKQNCCSLMIEDVLLKLCSETGLPDFYNF